MHLCIEIKLTVLLTQFNVETKVEKDLLKNDEVLGIERDGISRRLSAREGWIQRGLNNHRDYTNL